MYKKGTKIFQASVSNFATIINMPPKVSGKAAKKSGKAQKAIAKGDKKKKKLRRKESYAIYIYKVLKHETGSFW